MELQEDQGYYSNILNSLFYNKNLGEIQNSLKLTPNLERTKVMIPSCFKLKMYITMTVVNHWHNHNSPSLRCLSLHISLSEYINLLLYPQRIRISLLSQHFYLFLYQVSFFLSIYFFTFLCL